MDRLELFNAVKELSHRNDLSNFFDTALIMAESKIAQLLRVSEMVTYATIDTDTAPQVEPDSWALPLDFLEMREVTVPNGANIISLQSVGSDQAAAFSGPGGTGARFYSISDGLIKLRPGAQGATISLVYYAKSAALATDTDTHETITAFPEVYIFGSLVGVWTWAQDQAQKADANAEFLNAIKNANDFATNQQWGTGLKQFSGRNYNRRSSARWV